MTKEEEIKRNMKKLGISREEAEELYTADHEDIVTPEMAEMERKAKQIKRYEKSDKPRKQSEKVRKVDETKKRFINCIRVLLEGLFAEVEPLKNESELHFTYEGEKYTIKLIKHRPPKLEGSFLIGGAFRAGTHRAVLSQHNRQIPRLKFVQYSNLYLSRNLL